MIAIDFDGTLAVYESFEGIESVGEPIEGAIEFVRALRKMDIRLAIFSARAYDPKGKRTIENWIIEHDLQDDIEFVTHEKLPEFDLIVDDRAIRFEGDYRDALKQIIKTGRGKQNDGKP